ncbi:sulfur carrier protein ThiS [Desulfitobacterium sp. AusDCA]|uniref:sulfur carrier protein ThiS n=1 Tax=Desulfitobacterium sp. AusDCA TaxID=3240383 RepID=UPI003DA71D68
MKEMVIKVNGKEVQLKEGVTIKELLKRHNIQMPDYVMVYVNGEMLEQERYDEVIVKDQDMIEFVFFMSGGR